MSFDRYISCLREKDNSTHESPLMWAVLRNNYHIVKEIVEDFETYKREAAKKSERDMPVASGTDNISSHQSFDTSKYPCDHVNAQG